jgi:hypothetical protein
MNYDNPAARLLALLERGKKIPAGSTNCREAWQQLLNVTNDDPLLMSRIG